MFVVAVAFFVVVAAVVVTSYPLSPIDFARRDSKTVVF